MEHGQVLVIVAGAMIGLVAIMGLALDVGTMFIQDARLRRAVDAAALAAAVQIREGYDSANLAPAAEDFLNLNGIQTTSVSVEYCDLVTKLPADLCPDPPRKLVRVTAAAEAQLNFMQVLNIIPGWNLGVVPIAATATSETASIDMVLVLDRSESMTYDFAVGQKDGNGNQMRDPSVCNAVVDPLNYYTDSSHVQHLYTGDCQPFTKVKAAAIQFVENFMFEPYDHVAVISFAKDATYNLEFPKIGDTSNKDKVLETIAGLTVYEGDETMGDPPGSTAIYPDGNPSRKYDASFIYQGLGCPIAFIPDPLHPEYHFDPSQCTTTNMGAGLLYAGNEFNGGSDNQREVRQNSLWVTILLTDGVANAGYLGSESGPTYFCPGPDSGGLNTWFGGDTIGNPYATPPTITSLCNDAQSSTRHPRFLPDGTTNNPKYDAEDFAMDMADYVAKPSLQGQGAYLYTIGLGDQVTMQSPVLDTGYSPAKYDLLGQDFLQYAAETVGRGVYYDADTSDKLPEIFQAIADNIATILTK